MMDGLRRTFRTGKTKDLAFRRQQLLAFQAMLNENLDALCDAVWKDIRRCANEAFCLEVTFVKNDIQELLQKLDTWTRPEVKPKGVTQILDTPVVRKDPLGVVLIISPWNYPINLSLMPIAGALAAGNCVVLKPSEVSAHTSQVIGELINKYMDQSVVKVVSGGVEETTELLKERFDHIMYTGNPHVARIIMSAAAKHLTPVTLELGGKSPVIIDEGLSPSGLETAAKRIGWGKFLSAGQTCLAPDYVLCPPHMKAEFIKHLKQWVQTYYGENAQVSADYSRIPARRHFDRLVALIDDEKVIHGGRRDASDLYIEPTIMDNVTMDDAVMKDEIFGPILPILSCRSVDDAISIINDSEKPLAMYVFSENSKVVEKVVSSTSSGGVTVNDCLLHCGAITLPFGGVGNSGMGRYHGKYSFDTFTHEKAVLYRGFLGELLLSCRYPPFSPRKQFWLKVLTQHRPLPGLKDILKYFIPLLSVAIGVILGYFLWGRK